LNRGIDARKNQGYFASQKTKYSEQEINLYVKVTAKTYETDYEMPCISSVRDHRKRHTLDVG